MGSMSWIHWIIVLLILSFMLGLFGVPVARILKRAGFSPWLALLVFVPTANLICLWVFAFVDWPALKRDAPQSSGS
jgi:hypothetical protein